MSTDASTMFGSLEPQASGALGSGTLSGSYSFGTEGTQIGKRPTWVGTIVFQGSADQLLVDQASPSGLTVGASLPVTTDSFPGTTSGRGTLDGAGKYLAYIVSASQLAWIDTTAARPTVVVAEK